MKHLKQSLAILLSYALTFMPLHAATLQTDGTTNTNIDKAGNGVPVVNIANPNTTGLSHNKFSEYNVGKEGLILNNSRDTTVNTQLGGYIYGNSNLTSNAKVILNEVTSTSRSQLNGYTEVAGQRADLIIANPNGLSVNGAGFINTSNVTLTTGTPIINAGNLKSFNILGGDISIDGDGLDSMGQDSTSIYTHFLKLNAKMHAKDLDIKLGKNSIDANTKQIISSTNSNEVALLLDASALGGMYANRISLVGTDKGLGVNLPPEVLASAGEITITNDGNINLQKISASEDIKIIASSGNIELNDNLYSKNSTTLQANNDVKINNGTIASKNSVDIKSDNLINKASVVAGLNEDYTLNSTGVLSVTTKQMTNSGNLQASKTLNLNTATLSSTNGEMSAEDVNIVSDSIDSANTNILAVNNLNLSVKNKLANGGTIQANETLTINTAELENTSGNIIANDINVDATTSVTNSGEINSDNNLKLKTLNLTNNNIMTSLGDINIDSQNIDNTNAQLLANGNIAIVSRNSIINNSGVIKSNNDVSIEATTLKNNNGNIESLNNLYIDVDNIIDLTNSNLYAKNDFTLKLNTLNNISTSSIGSGRNLNIEATDYIINDSDILADGSLTLNTSGTLTNQKTIASANDLFITSNSLTNNRTIFSGKDMYLYTKNNLINNQDALILAVNNLKLSESATNSKTKLIENRSAKIETINGDINIFANSFKNIVTKAPTKKSYVESSGFIGLRYMPGSRRTYENRTITIEYLDKTGYIPSTLIAGRNIYVNADTNNEYSLMAASGNLHVAGSLSNSANLIANKIIRTTGYVQQCMSNSWPRSGCSWYHKYNTDVTTLTQLDSADSTIQAGGSISADVSSLVNTTVKKDEDITSATTINNETDIVTNGNKDALLTPIVVPKDDYGLFVKNKNPLSKFLIETNPKFALYDNFISSDYMMSRIDYDSQATTKKLGDALYENTIIRDSIFKQTGRRFLNKDIKNDNDQYKLLMDNAISTSKALELSPGISLNKEQINALTQDIVWMEEQEIEGIKVLVPVVYIADASKYRLEGARIIAGESININASDSVSNMSGDIIAGENINIQATNDILNISANIKAKNIDLSSTNGNVVNKRSAEEVSFSAIGSKGKTTLVDKESQIIASNILNITAAKNIKIQGSKLQATDINLKAKDIDIATTIDKKEFAGGDADNYVKEKSTTHLASNLDAKNININSSDTTSIKGSNLNATNDINIKAKKLDILAVNNSTNKESKSSSSGTFSSSSTTTKEATSTNIASILSGKNIKLTTTEDDIDVIGSNLEAKETLALDSAKDINIKAGYEVDYSETTTVKTDMFDGNNLYSASMDNVGNYDKTAVSSNLKATNISFKSNTTNIEGSNLEADGSIDIDASDINIKTAKEEHKTWEQHEKLSISADQALEGLGNLGLNMATLGQAKAGGDDSDIINIKASYSKTQEETKSIKNVASNIKAGEDLTLKANDGDINIVGSNLAAGADATLDASNDVNIVAAYDKDSHSFKETSGEVEVKLTSDEGVETKIDLTLKDEKEDISKALGSTIASGSNLVIKSKNDTSIIGSDLSSMGDTSIQTGGELKIAAAKNTSTKSVDNLEVHIYGGGVPDIQVGDGQVEAEIGQATIDKIKKTTKETTASLSSVNSNANIEMDSEKSISIEGANLSAKEDVILTAKEDITIKETKETNEVDSEELHGVATAKVVVANEYAKIAYALEGVKVAKDGVGIANDKYDEYKVEVSKQEAKLAELEQKYEAKTGFIELADVEEFKELLNDLKEDDKYYQANIALATTTLATKTTALLAQTAKAATSSASYGMSASLELDIDAIETQLKEYEQRSVASNIAGDNIVINAKNKATIQGSNLQANNNIDIDAKTTDILASKDNHDQSEDTQHQNVNISIGTSGFSMSASADNSESTNVQATHANSDLQANNININTKETTTIKGATIKAEDTLTLNSKNLEVASVQNTSKQKSHSEGVSAGVGGGTLTSLGANASNSDAKAKETLLTSLTGNKVDINTEQETRLRGATIAAVDADGNDNSNLNLKTDTLLASSLNNTKTSKSTSVGINLGGSAKENTLSNVSLDYSNDTTNSKTKTLATLGNGNIQIGNKEDSDTKMLNTDIANNEVDIYNISSHKGLKGELDTRLLTENGRNQIAEDLLKSSMIVDTITQIVTNETVDVTDFFSNTAKENTTYEAVKEKIAQDPALAKALSNPDLTPEQKEQMMDGVTDAVMIKLGYETHDNKLIATDEKGRDNKDIKGYHSLDTKNSYINETNIDNGNEGLIEVAGTEAQRSIDRQEGSTFNQSQEYRDDRSDFSQNVGTNISNYTNFALNLTGQDSMTNYNKARVTTTPSIFNTVAANNAEFAGLDKSRGDNFPWSKEPIYATGGKGGVLNPNLSFFSNVYPTRIPPIPPKTNANPISGYTKHGLNQSIGRDGGIGVKPKAILDAVKHPTKVPKNQNNGATKYTGKNATVVLNKNGKIITAWPKNSKGRRK